MNHVYGRDSRHCALCGADLSDTTLPMDGCPVEMDGEARWVAHSPYPNGTWRGIEKCSSPDCRFDALFYTEEECQQFIDENKLGPYLRPVLVVISYPLVGAQLYQPKEEV